jgi:hypothetical protein
VKSDFTFRDVIVLIVLIAIVLAVALWNQPYERNISPRDEVSFGLPQRR